MDQAVRYRQVLQKELHHLLVVNLLLHGLILLIVHPICILASEIRREISATTSSSKHVRARPPSSRQIQHRSEPTGIVLSELCRRRSEIRCAHRSGEGSKLSGSVAEVGHSTCVARVKEGPERGLRVTIREVGVYAIEGSCGVVGAIEVGAPLVALVVVLHPVGRGVVVPADVKRGLRAPLVRGGVLHPIISCI